MEKKSAKKTTTSSAKPKSRATTRATAKTGAKATSKPRAKPAAGADKLLTKVPVECVFWCSNGSIFSDLRELAAGLEAMSDETYAYHCNQEKQDFVNWVRDVIRDKTLATDLAMAVNRMQAAQCTAARISMLTGNR